MNCCHATITSPVLPASCSEPSITSLAIRSSTSQGDDSSPVSSGFPASCGEPSEESPTCSELSLSSATLVVWVSFHATIRVCCYASAPDTSNRHSLAVLHCL